MREFEVGGETYRTGKIDARVQFHIVRRLAPAIAGLLGGVSGTGEGKKFDLLAAVGPFSQALGSMSDADTDYVIDACLKPISRRLPGDAGWGAVLSNGGDMMYDDITLADMTQLAFAAAEDNLGGFFDALQAKFGDAMKGARP